MVHTVDRPDGVRPNQTSSSPDTLAFSAPGCLLTTTCRGPIHCQPSGHVARVASIPYLVSIFMTYVAEQEGRELKLLPTATLLSAFDLISLA